ncbi:MAG TPA: phosphate ABC transporter permease PstA [Euryarchaeota archaeon]|nr:phosphate ABC transporter permease PstA [Euryarchaeota archaeon]
MIYGNLKVRKLKDRLAYAIALLCVFAAAAPLISILLDVLVKGLPQFSMEFFTSELPSPGTGEPGGIGPAMIGSMYVIMIGSAIGIPIGIFSGIYVSEYGNNWFGRSVRFLTEVLSGLPSIVVGIFAFLLLVLGLGGPTAYAGGFALSIIMVPVVSRSTEESLKLVPNTIREASLALGVPRWKTTLKVVLSHGRAGIITGVILSIARIAGESAPLLLTVGWSPFVQTSLSEPISTMPVLIYLYGTSPYENWINVAWGTSAFLVIFILSLSIGVRLLTRGRFAYSRL